MAVLGISPQLIRAFTSDENRKNIAMVVENVLHKKYPSAIITQGKLYEIQLGFLHWINELNFKIYEDRETEEVLIWLNDYFMQFLVARCEETYAVYDSAQEAMWIQKQFVYTPFPQKGPILIESRKDAEFGHRCCEKSDAAALSAEYGLKL